MQYKMDNVYGKDSFYPLHPSLFISKIRFSDVFSCVLNEFDLHFSWKSIIREIRFFEILKSIG